MIHVAVLLRSYLDLILAGEKTVECRLTLQARDPYERVEAGDRIYFKQSAGPYAAMAMVEHTLFESDLTPHRVKVIKRDYNHLIRGEDDFWRIKRDANYCTLIWVKDVQPTSTGPAIRPLQGVAWLCLEEDPAWRRSNAPGAATARSRAANQPFEITITSGNIKNNTLYATDVIDRFPESCIGGAKKADAGRPITLMLHEGPTVCTDIVGTRKLIRTRVWGRWFRTHGVKPGDRVVFSPVDESTYFVGLVRTM